MAGGVIGHRALMGCIDVLDAQDLDEELGELISTGPEAAGLFEHLGVVFEEVRIVDPDH